MLETSSGRFRCRMDLGGGSNRAPDCPGGFGLVPQSGADVCIKGGPSALIPTCGGKKWQLMVDQRGTRDQCVKRTKKKGDQWKDPECERAGFTYQAVSGRDRCEPKKTVAYRCPAGNATVDSDGSNDRCIRPSEVSIVEPRFLPER